MTVKYALKQENALSRMIDAYLRIYRHEKMLDRVWRSVAWEKHDEERRKAADDLRAAEIEYREAVCEEVMET